MQTILVILKSPDPKSRVAVDGWNETMHEIHKLLPPKACASDFEEASEGTFLIRGSGGLPAFAIALVLARQKGIPAKVLFLDSATEWAQ